MESAWSRRWRAVRRYAGAFAATALALAIVVVSGTALLRTELSPKNAASSDWLHWLIILSGNWSPGNTSEKGTSFALSATIAVLLNNALWVVLAGEVWRRVLTRRFRMKLGEAFTTRDQMNKQALFDALPNDRDLQIKINEAFKEGEKRWRENLFQVFGQRRARKLMDVLYSDID